MAGISKITIGTENGDRVLVDLTGDSVNADSLVVGHTAHGADGEVVEGANPYELEATNDEIGTQKDLISQISAALEGKAAPSSGKPEQQKTVTITENGAHTVNPDTGYTMSKVTVNVNVPSDEPNIQPLNVTENGTYTPSGDLDGYGPVTVNVASSGGGDTSVEDGLVTRTLTEYTNNRVTSVGANAFQGFSALTAVSLPNATSAGSSAFNTCSGLRSVHLPALKSINVMSFYSCSSLETIDLPSLTTTSSQGIRNCSKLVKADLGNPSSLAALLFDGCSLLETLIIRTTKLCTLGATSAISDTKIAKGTGYVYVPRSLVDSYKAATNWSTYAAQFRAIEDYPDITGG